MTFANYNRDIPFSSNNPSADQPDMLQNNNSIQDIIAIDHVGFNANNGGYHTIVHQPNQTIAGQSVWDPVIPSATRTAIQGTKIAGVQQTFSLNATDRFGTDTQLFSMTGNGGIAQLTGGNASPNGYQWIGGVLIQWGTGTFTLGLATVVFASTNNTINFPNNIFSLVATGTSTSPVVLISKSNTQFQLGSGGGTPTFNWIAIGN